MPQDRVNSTIVRHKDFLYFFGGCKTLNCTLATDYWDDVLRLDLQTESWKVIEYPLDEGVRKIAPKPTKFAAAAKFKDKAAISGGKTFESVFFDDFWLFHFGILSLLDINLWMKLVVEYSKRLQYLSQGYSNHTVIGLDKDDRNALQDHLKKKHDIVLMFGGRNEQRLLPPDLIAGKISRNKVSFEKIATKGQSPCSRYNHSMTYLQKLNAVVVFGGQGLDIEMSEVANHLYVLNLLSLEWFSCKVRSLQGSSFDSRYCHGVAALKDTLIIFGGLNEEGFIHSTVEVVKVLENPTFDLEEMVEQAGSASDQSPTKPKQNKKMERQNTLQFLQLLNVQSVPQVVRNVEVKTSFLPTPIENSSSQSGNFPLVNRRRDRLWAKIKLATVISKLNSNVAPRELQRASSLKK